MARPKYVLQKHPARSVIFYKFIIVYSPLAQTKHYQTLFLSPDIRLVDCPGLVIPNYVPMEDQVRASDLRPTPRAPEGS